MEAVHNHYAIGAPLAQGDKRPFLSSPHNSSTTSPPCWPKHCTGTWWYLADFTKFSFLHGWRNTIILNKLMLPQKLMEANCLHKGSHRQISFKTQNGHSYRNLIYMLQLDRSIIEPPWSCVCVYLCTHEAGAFLATAAPTDGSWRRHVFREWVSSNSCKERGREKEEERERERVSLAGW